MAQFADPDMRHAALTVRNNRLLVFYSQAGETPERILLSEIDMTVEWQNWRATPPQVILEPEFDHEGANEELRASVRGLADKRLHELRDPAIFSEGENDYLLYSIAGESGIALAKISFT